MGMEVNPLRKLPLERYIAALQRNKAFIEDGLQLDMVDSNVVGNKYLAASWGMCSSNYKLYPDKEDHIWPQQFKHENRFAPIERPDKCPMDRRDSETVKGTLTGCYYTCRLFNPRHGESRPNREQVIELYDIEIKRLLK